MVLDVNLVYKQQTPDLKLVHTQINEATGPAVTLSHAYHPGRAGLF